MILEGYVTDKNKSPVANALIEVKGEDFITLFSAESNESGYYKLDMPAGKYPFLTAETMESTIWNTGVKISRFKTICLWT